MKKIILSSILFFALSQAQVVSQLQGVPNHTMVYPSGGNTKSDLDTANGIKINHIQIHTTGNHGYMDADSVDLGVGGTRIGSNGAGLTAQGNLFWSINGKLSSNDSIVASGKMRAQILQDAGLISAGSIGTDSHGNLIIGTTSRNDSAYTREQVALGLDTFSLNPTQAGNLFNGNTFFEGVGNTNQVACFTPGEGESPIGYHCQETGTGSVVFDSGATIRTVTLQGTTLGDSSHWSKGVVIDGQIKAANSFFQTVPNLNSLGYQAVCIGPCPTLKEPDHGYYLNVFSDSGLDGAQTQLKIGGASSSSVFHFDPMMGSLAHPKPCDKGGCVSSIGVRLPSYTNPTDSTTPLQSGGNSAYCDWFPDTISTSGSTGYSAMHMQCGIVPQESDIRPDYEYVGGPGFKGSGELNIPFVGYGSSFSTVHPPQVPFHIRPTTFGDSITGIIPSYVMEMVQHTNTNENSIEAIVSNKNGAAGLFFGDAQNIERGGIDINNHSGNLELSGDTGIYFYPNNAAVSTVFKRNGDDSVVNNLIVAKNLTVRGTASISNLNVGAFVDIDNSGNASFTTLNLGGAGSVVDNITTGTTLATKEYVDDNTSNIYHDSITSGLSEVSAKSIQANDGPISGGSLTLSGTANIGDGEITMNVGGTGDASFGGTITVDSCDGCVGPDYLKKVNFADSVHHYVGTPIGSTQGVGTGDSPTFNTGTFANTVISTSMQLNYGVNTSILAVDGGGFTYGLPYVGTGNVVLSASPTLSGTVRNTGNFRTTGTDSVGGFLGVGLANSAAKRIANDSGEMIEQGGFGSLYLAYAGAPVLEMGRINGTPGAGAPVTNGQNIFALQSCSDTTTNGSLLCDNLIRALAQGTWSATNRGKTIALTSTDSASLVTHAYSLARGYLSNDSGMKVTQFSGAGNKAAYFNNLGVLRDTTFLYVGATDTVPYTDWVRGAAAQIYNDSITGGLSAISALSLNASKFVAADSIFMTLPNTSIVGVNSVGKLVDSSSILTDGQHNLNINSLSSSGSINLGSGEITLNVGGTGGAHFNGDIDVNSCTGCVDASYFEKANFVDSVHHYVGTPTGSVQGVGMGDSPTFNNGTFTGNIEAAAGLKLDYMPGSGSFLISDAGDNMLPIGSVGSGSVVLSASPTLSGTVRNTGNFRTTGTDSVGGFLGVGLANSAAKRIANDSGEMIEQGGFGSLYLAYAGAPVLEMGRINGTPGAGAPVTNGQNIFALQSCSDTTTNGSLLCDNLIRAQAQGTWSITNRGQDVSISSVDSGTTVTRNMSLTRGDLVVPRHYLTSDSTPVLSSCGTSPAITTGSSDVAGEITEGTIATGCTITFQTAFKQKPFCTVTEQSGLSASYTTSNSAITITNIGALSSTKLNYICIGN